jgi:1-acyl-sn-glycerol-3-phosphate acyltransferase
MAYLRLAAICGALILLLLLIAPVQWLALRARWDLRHAIPVASCRILAWLLQLRVVAHGEMVPGQARLLAANHVSWLDIIALGSMAPACFLAKREVASWPVIAFFVRVQETVLVDRNRRRSIPGANAAMAQRMLAGRAMVLFPEGTTGDGTALKKFHSSHVASARDLLATAAEVDKVAVQPVAIRYSSPHAAWFGDATLLPHVWAIVSGKPIRCEIAFGEALPYRRGADRKEVTREIATRIGTLLEDAAPCARAVFMGEAGAASIDTLAPLGS